MGIGIHCFLLLSGAIKYFPPKQQRKMQYSDTLFAGDLFIANTNLPYYSMASALNILFFHFHLNYQHCLLTIDCNTVSIFQTSEGNF